MTHVLSLGAINKLTGEYVYPKIANKKDEYICPECKKDLILCQGSIKVHHFRHKVDNVNPCHHYSNPTESQIHKDAKMLLKNLLQRKNQISFIRNCCCCKKNEEFEIPEISEYSVIEIEYRFEYNGVKIADVAYIDDAELLCIFEICNTHKTCSENRPEPWFEIDAENLIKMANNNTLSSLQIKCIRVEKCDECIEREKKRLKQEKLDKLELRQIKDNSPEYRFIKNDVNFTLSNNVFDIIHPLTQKKIKMSNNFKYCERKVFINGKWKGYGCCYENCSITRDIINWYHSKPIIRKDLINELTLSADARVKANLKDAITEQYMRAHAGWL